jgi:hypothetical protein
MRKQSGSQDIIWAAMGSSLVRHTGYQAVGASRALEEGNLRLRKVSAQAA